MAYEQFSLYDMQQAAVEPVQLEGPHGDPRGQAARLSRLLARVALQGRAQEACRLPTRAAATPPGEG